MYFEKQLNKKRLRCVSLALCVSFFCFRLAQNMPLNILTATARIIINIFVLYIHKCFLFFLWCAILKAEAFAHHNNKKKNQNCWGLLAFQSKTWTKILHFQNAIIGFVHKIDTNRRIFLFFFCSEFIEAFKNRTFLGRYLSSD